MHGLGRLHKAGTLELGCSHVDRSYAVTYLCRFGKVILINLYLDSIFYKTGMVITGNI